MGGRPTVSGGMTSAEYSAMLEKQAKIAADAETTRQKNLMAYEEQRKAAEAEQLRLAKQSEQLSIAQQQAAEAETAKELEAMGEVSTPRNIEELTEEEYQKLTGMFGSLYSGTTESYLQRPQG